MKAAFFLVGIFSLVIVTTSLDDDQCSKCAFNTDFRNNEPANECCKYFKDTCCTAAENNFLHTMFIVAIVVGVIIFLMICACVICCVCCCVCCASRGGGTTRHIYTPLNNPNTTVISTTNVTKA